MKRLLWVGDAACQSGFARATHKILDSLVGKWEIDVCGINYRGIPHEYPYRIWPAALLGDTFGIEMLPVMIAQRKFDVVVVMNDPWNFPEYLDILKEFRVLGIVAVDGKNIQGRKLNGLACALFWTKFGQQEAVNSGYGGPSAIIPLGVDTDVYYPQDKKLCRQMLGFNPDLIDKFIVGNVNRNQPRKRLDLTIAYFAEWVHRYERDDARLYLHVAPTGDRDGYDVVQLAEYYGVLNKLLLAQPKVWNGPSEQYMARTYNSFDVNVNTGQGEGMGLTALEGMACGVPLIAGDWSALGEWAAPAAELIPCTSQAVTIGSINVIGGVPDREEFIQAIERVYSDAQLRYDRKEAGLRLACHPNFSWPVICENFSKVLDQLLELPVRFGDAFRSAGAGRERDGREDPAVLDEIPAESGTGACR